MAGGGVMVGLAWEKEGGTGGPEDNLHSSSPNRGSIALRPVVGDQRPDRYHAALGGKICPPIACVPARAGGLNHSLRINPVGQFARSNVLRGARFPFGPATGPLKTWGLRSQVASPIVAAGCLAAPAVPAIEGGLPSSVTVSVRIFFPPQRAMQILRYRDSAGNIHLGARHAGGQATRLEGELFGNLRDTREPAQVAKLLAPLQPADIVCIGLNYRKHAEEGGQPIPEYPVVFMKTSSACQNPGDPIVLPRRLRSDAVDYECELAVVIGKPCHNVSRADALNYVLGYTCANDVSARDWQIKKGGSQWCRGKTFATFCPLGPALVTADEIPNPNVLGIKTVLNGQTMQDWNTNDMIFDVPTLIEFLSGSTLLSPGTVILTGTPHGVGGARKPPVFLQPGDTVTIEIEKIGSLTNPVIEETC